MKLVIHTDGGARGNPGPAAIGVVIEQDGKQIAGFGKKIGETTNNVAEYTAVAEALRHLLAARLSPSAITFVLDSTLVANQLSGTFKIKDAKLRELMVAVRQLEQQVGGAIAYTVVRREQNVAADALVNQALDA